MNFDSIEGLTEFDIEQLYENANIEGPMLGATQVHECLCSTVIGSSSSHCVATDFSSGLCSLDCDETQVYSDSACRAKCQELCGWGGAHHLVHTGLMARFDCYMPCTNHGSGGYGCKDRGYHYWHSYGVFVSCDRGSGSTYCDANYAYNYTLMYMPGCGIGWSGAQAGRGSGSTWRFNETQWLYIQRCQVLSR